MSFFTSLALYQSNLFYTYMMLCTIETWDKTLAAYLEDLLVHLQKEFENREKNVNFY